MTAREAIGKVVAEAQRFTLPPPDGVVLTRGTDLNPEPIQWLWTHWLALGKLHILAGPPGQGKTTLALAAGATVSIGGRWPDGTRCDAGNVLIWSGEDDAADTLLPRLIASGADRGRCYFVEATRIEGESQPFDPARDMPQLLAAVDRIGGIRLLIVDPVVSAVSGDSHKNAEVRKSLQPLVDLAKACNCAVLGITHFSKNSSGSDPTMRVVGSVAFSAVARVVMVAAKVQGEGDTEARILARSKSNIGPDEGGFEYTIAQTEALPGIMASRVEWGKVVEGTARELLTDPDEPKDDQEDDAAEMLRAELVSDCWTDSNTATRPLKAAGFTKKQIWAASKKLGVIRKKGGMNAGWYWRLPASGEVRPFIFDPPLPAEDSAEGSEGSTSKTLESSESSGDLESSGTSLQ